MKGAKTAHKLAENLHGADKLDAALLRSFEKAHDFRRARRRTPLLGSDDFLVFRLMENRYRRSSERIVPQRRCRTTKIYSHSIVAGGFEEIS
jgi:hypothetical protein